jgi:hypothetical protein
VDPSGNVTFFTSLTDAGDVTFDPTGAYGNEMFATSSFSGPISKVTSAGVVSTWSTVTSTYVRFGPGGAWGTGLYSTSQSGLGPGIVTVDVAGVGTLFSGGFTTPEGFDWDPTGDFGFDMFAPDLSTGEIWRVTPTGTRTLFATVAGSASVNFCHGVMYVTAFHGGGCYKITPAATPTEASSWGRVKTLYR